MATLPGLKVGITLDSATFVAETRRVNASVQQMGRGIEQQTSLMARGFNTAASAAKSLAAGLAVGFTVAAVAGLGRIARGAIDMADNLNDLSKQTGLSVSALQAFQRHAELSGSSAEQMNTGLLQMTRGIGQLQAGTGRLGSQLRKLNPELADQLLAVRDQEAALNLVAEALQNAGSEAERQAIAIAVFGDAGRELGVAFSEGAEGVAKAREESKRLGEISAEAAVSAARANDELDRMSQILSTSLSQAFLAAAPQIEGFVFLLNEAAIGARNFFEEMNAVGAEKLNFQIAELNGQMAQLVARRRELSEVAEAQGIAPAETFAVQIANQEIAAVTKQRDALIAQRDAMGAVTEASKPLEVSIHKRVEATDKAATSTNKLAEAERGLLTLYKNDVEADRKLRSLTSMQRQAEALAKADKELASKPILTGAGFEEATNELDQVYENFLQNVQNETANTFREILDGGIKSFDDLFDTALDLAKDFASQMAAALVFNPQLIGSFGGSGFGGAEPALATQLNPAAGGTRTGPGGLLVGGGATSSMGAPASTINWGGIAGAGILGGLGGATLGAGLFGGGKTATIGGGLGGAGGAATGALIGSIFPGIGTATGALVGGLLGGVGGGFLGSLFGGGDDKTRGGFSGAIGSATTFGDSEIASIVKKVDQSILGLLDARQAAIAKKVKSSGFLSVSGGLSSSDIEGIGSARIGGVASALGFNRGRILQGDTEQALKNLQTAIETQRAIEELTGNLTAYDRQVQDVTEQFRALRLQAQEFGVSTKGLTEAYREQRVVLREARRDEIEARAEARRQADAQIAGLLDPFSQLADPLRAFQTQIEFAQLNPAQQLAKAQADFDRIVGLAEGGDVGALSQLQGASQLLIDLAERFGASPGGAAAREDVADAITTALDRIEEARKEAESSIQAEVRRASREQIEVLRDIVESVDRAAAEIRKSARQVRA